MIGEERCGRCGRLVNALDALGVGYDLHRDVRRALFPGSTISLRIAGEDDSLEHLERADLLEHYYAHYTIDNAVLVIAGNVEPQAALDRATAYFGNLERRGRVPVPATPPYPKHGPHKVVVRGPLITDQAGVMIGARTVGRLHPDRWPLLVLAELLSQDLTKEIRYRQGLVYGLDVYNDQYADAGYFVIGTTSASNKRAAILAEIEKHLLAVRRNEIKSERVAEVQAGLLGNWALSMEDNVSRADWLTQWALALADDQPVPDYRNVVGAVTAADLARVVETYFKPQWRYLGLHQPILTVARGARATGVAAGLGLSMWLARTWLRGRKR